MINLFEDAYLVSLVAKRETLFPIDMKLVRYLRGNSLVGVVATNSLDIIKRDIDHAVKKKPKKIKKKPFKLNKILEDD